MTARDKRTTKDNNRPLLPITPPAPLNNNDNSSNSNNNNENSEKKKRRDNNVSTYLDSFLHNFDSSSSSSSSIVQRVTCCGKKQSIYCTDCFRLLLGQQQQQQHDCSFVDLPFDLEILLDDRRNSSTGIHAMVMLNASAASTCLATDAAAAAEMDHENVAVDEDDDNDGNKEEKKKDDYSNIASLSIQENNKNKNTTNTKKVTLVDTTRGDPIPLYNNNSNTYLLFPSSKSIPLSSVSTSMTKLIVLDCKWTKSSLIKHDNLQNVQHVHLSNPPDESYFWRWHKEGKGMLSTIEAIYYASLEVMDGRRIQQQYQQRTTINEEEEDTKLGVVNGNHCSNNSSYGREADFENNKDYKMNDNNNNNNNKNDSGGNKEEEEEEEESNLIHLLYLFALKRSIMNIAAQNENRTLPFTKEGKEEQRLIRHYNATEKQRRDKEKGKILKEEARRKREEEEEKKKKKMLNQEK